MFSTSYLIILSFSTGEIYRFYNNKIIKVTWLRISDLDLGIRLGGHDAKKELLRFLCLLDSNVAVNFDRHSRYIYFLIEMCKLAVRTRFLTNFKGDDVLNKNMNYAKLELLSIISYSR